MKRTLFAIACILACATLGAAAPAADTTAATASPCASTHALCGADTVSGLMQPAASSSSSTPVCCPVSTSVCQRAGGGGFRCVALAEAAACDSCCSGAGGGSHCTYATGSHVTSTATPNSPSVMVPEFRTLQCCGRSAGQAFCCPTRRASTTIVAAAATATATTADENATGTDKQSASSGGALASTSGPVQQCRASPGSWSCEDAPSSILQVSVSLALWQLILCVVGGVVFCGAVGGGGHRAHGGHCSNDCQACSAFIGGCLLFECCRGGGAGGQPLLG